MTIRSEFEVLRDVLLQILLSYHTYLILRFRKHDRFAKVVATKLGLFFDLRSTV